MAKAKKDDTLPTKEPAPLAPSQIPAEFTPGFRAKPLPAGMEKDWWSHTPRFIKVLRDKKTGKMRLTSDIASHPDTENIPPGTNANIAGHEIMMVLDLMELLQSQM